MCNKFNEISSNYFITGFQTISNADFWQIAGIVALEAANTKVNITFKGGRVDCLSSPYHDGDSLFPGASMNREEMMKWFQGTDDGFGMDEEQVTISILTLACKACFHLLYLFMPL